MHEQRVGDTPYGTATVEQQRAGFAAGECDKSVDRTRRTADQPRERARLGLAIEHKVLMADLTRSFHDRMISVGPIIAASGDQAHRRLPSRSTRCGPLMLSSIKLAAKELSCRR